MWQTLSLNTTQFDLFRRELDRITPVIHSADRRNNFILVNSKLQQLMLTPTFHMILAEIIPMLRSIDPVTLEQAGYSIAAKDWSFLFGDQQYYHQLINAGTLKISF